MGAAVTKVNVNGRIFGRFQARVSVFDRGFLYGDSVYEVLRTYGGAPFAFHDHLRRLARSARLLGMRLPRDEAWMCRELLRTLRAAGNRESYVRIVVTRGDGPIGIDPALARDPVTLFIVQPLRPPPAVLYRRGVRVALVPLSRGGDGSVDPAAKSGNYLSSILALRRARRSGAHEAILVNRRGLLCEGSTSNLFLVRHGRLFTPALSAGILEGITRRRVIRLAREMGLAVKEADLRAVDLTRADEAFLTSTIREVLPIGEVGAEAGPRHRIGAGRPGPVTTALRRAFHARARRDALLEWTRVRSGVRR